MSIPESGNVLQQYHYDAVDRLVALQSPNRAASRRFYSGAVLCNEQDVHSQRSHLRAGEQLVGLRELENGMSTVRLIGADQAGSVLHVLSDDAPLVLAYTPHGEGADSSLPGFNGEQPDPLTGNYLLGDGYRAYNPTLMRFHSPDSFSPFGGGGLNPYTYCLGDPVNRVDPTGHLSWQAGLGIGLGVLGLIYAGVALYFGAVALSAEVTAASVAAIVAGTTGFMAAGTGIAQAIVEERAPGSSAAATLGWVSLGLGVASLITGITATALSPANQIKPLQMSSLIQDTSLAERLAEYGAISQMERAASAGLFGSFPTTWVRTKAMSALIGMLGADDLTALASTSSAMRKLVYENLRPLNRVLPQSLTINQFVSRAETIGTGARRGMLPVQLSRAGYPQAAFPALADPSTAPNNAARFARAARINRIELGINRQLMLRALWDVGPSVVGQP